MKQRRLDALHPGGALIDQRVAHPRPRAPPAHVFGRDPRLGRPAIGQQLAQPAGVLAVGLGSPLAPAQRARLDGLGEMRRRARGGQRVAAEQRARARLDRDMDLATEKRPVQRATAAGVESIRPRVISPVSVSNASKVICARCT